MRSFTLRAPHRNLRSARPAAAAEAGVAPTVRVGRVLLGALALFAGFSGLASPGAAASTTPPTDTAAAGADATTAPADKAAADDTTPPTDTAAADADATTEPDASSSKGVNVIEVTGYIDPIMKRFILSSVDKAVSDGVEALVIQLDSPGSLLPQRQLDALEKALREEKRVPIAVWVGPLGARANGGANRLVSAADVVGMAPSTHIGNSTPAAVGDPLVGRRYTQNEAVKAGLAESNAPVLVQFVGELDGRTIAGKTLDTAFPATEADGKRTAKVNAVRFAKLGLLDRLLHTAVNPSVAYLLFVIALALFVFEFFTGGIGIAAFVGLAAFVLAVAGLGNLPTRPVGVVLIVVAMLGFAIDVQAGSPRFWTGVGTIGLVAGSFTLFTEGIRVPLYMIGVMVLMTVLFMVNGMPTMVRTRFATPTIGREAMIGEVGTAVDGIGPEGVVRVLGAPWRARTNRATPIAAGAPVRVVAVDGLLLEVEPLEGGAKDAGH